MPESTAFSQQTPLVDSQHPWLGLLSFKEAHRAFFFGRDAEITEILGRIRENPLTTLFGQSGLGKTSLIGAAVVPELRDHGFAPVHLRLDYDTSAPSLLEQTHTVLRKSMPKAAWPEAAAATTLWELFHCTPPLLPDGASAPVLIFDQFEEIFTLGRQSADRERETELWLEQIADLLQNRPPRLLEERFAENRRLARDYDFSASPVRIVFSLREDYLSHLEGWKSRLPLLTQNRMGLQLLNGPKALEAVLGPASLGAEPLLTREVAASIVRTVARKQPDTPLTHIKAVPPLLSLLCEQLNAARLSVNGAQISADMVSGQSDNILQRFYEDSFSVFPVQHREVIRALIEDPPMVTEGGFRNALVRDDAEATLTRAGMAAASEVFDVLIQRRLITVEEKDRVQRLEVTHDVLVPMLVRSRKERRNRMAKEQAERALAEEATKTRKRRLITAAMALLTVLAVAGAIYGLRSANQAQAAEVKAAAQLEESRYNEGLAWLLRAEVAEERSKRYPETLLYAAQAIGFEGFGRPADSEVPLRYIPNGREAFTRASKWISDRPAYRPVWASALQKSPVTAMRISPSGRLLAVAHADGFGVLWDMSTGTESFVLPPSAEPVNDIAFDPAEQLLAVTTAKATQLFDLQKRHYITSHPGAGSATAFSPGGEILAVAAKTGDVVLWQMGHPTTLTAGLSAPATRLEFSAENSIIAVAYAGKGVRLFFPHAGAAAHAWMMHAADATSVAVSPDGARIAIGTSDGGISLWSSTEARQLGSLPEELRHRGEVLDLAFRPDGRQLASASGDGTVKLWNVTANIPSVMVTLCGHNGAVSRVAYTPAGDFLASAGADGSARLWAVGGKPEPKADLFTYLNRRFYEFDPAAQQALWAGGSGFVGAPPIIGSAKLDRATLLADAQKASTENRWHLVDLRLQQFGTTDDGTVQQLLTARSSFARAGEAFTNAEGMHLRWCPPTGPEGFFMGSPETEEGRSIYESLHKVILTQGFWLSQYEVTQAEWIAVMGSNPSTYASSGLQAPVENVSWSEAVDFCRRLTDRERGRGTLPPGFEYALPSEAQWEYACRAGTTTAYSFGDDPALLHLHGNYNDKSGGSIDADTEHDDGFERTAPVGSYKAKEIKPNAWGFHDMHGNVNEWCAEALDPNVADYSADATTDPLGTQGTHRVARGGGWSRSPSNCRSANRNANSPSNRDANLGFRPAVVHSRPEQPRRNG
jgi:formylglycine-generating enzyme required for sulfatase activity